MKKQQNKFDIFIKFLIAVLPCTVFFSFQPLLYFGTNESMNFELSVPLIFLVFFDIISAIYFIKTFKTKAKSYPWKKIAIFSLLPFYAALSIVWSANKLRGFLTAGILWTIFFAVISLIWLYRDFYNKNFAKKCLKIFMIFSLAMCGFCWIQCILDVAGIPRDKTLMCLGCGYGVFGFPHPNGFMAEPQYIGGILLAPTLISFYLFLKKPSFKSSLLAFAFSATLLLTLSRGAIFAFGISGICLFVISIAKRKNIKALYMPLIVLAAFIFTLNSQGIFSQLSATDDTYYSGISKALNQLSLGVIDLGLPDNNSTEVNVIENQETNQETEAPEKSRFDGYVESSTDIRLVLTKASFALWAAKPNYTLFGVGIGGANAAIYHDFVNPGELQREDIKNELIATTMDTPRMNVQNEYAEIFIEFGIIGAALIILIAITFLNDQKLFTHAHSDILVSIAVAYMVASFFCSGLPNSLYIYLFIPLLSALSKNESN